MTKLRVLLADDHAVVREGLKVLVNAQPDMEVVGEAEEGNATCRLALDLRPDIVVMDISMPGLSGVQAAERIRRECPEVRILVLTVHELGGYLRRVLEAGASGYVLKRAVGEELLRAIREVAHGRVYLDPHMSGQVVAGFIGTTPSEGSGTSELTEREVEIVKLLARGFINREIADQLDLSIKTIEVHKARALEKLGLHSRADLVQYALHQGWLQTP